jgi:membrane fusion protein (multidrug efflux system)
MNAQTHIPAEDLQAANATNRSRRRLRAVLMLGALVIVAVGALWFYLTGGRTESTDNAALQAGMVAVSPSVAGKVVAIEVRENQHVRAGQVLFRIDRAGYDTTVAQAEASLADARTAVGASRADYQAAQSEISAAEARYTYARGEVGRQASLVKEGISSRQQYAQAVADAATARDAIATAQARAASLLAGSSGTAGGSPEAQPKVQRAAAALAQARVALDDTVVRAPADGVVTRVNQLQVGNYVQPGRAVFMLSGTRFWVQANFKEDQLRYMRLGQPATITVDAFPDLVLHGHVESFSPGTGSSFSVLPAENATGNWVKVVQRLPAQIAIDDAPGDLPLSAGLSVDVTVDTGHRRHLFGPDTPPSSPAQGQERGRDHTSAP